MAPRATPSTRCPTQDPSFKSLKEAEEKAKREKENAEAMERLSREASAENSGAEEA